MKLHYALLVAVIFLFSQYARGGWKPDYALQPQKVQDWYKSRELTPQTRKRLDVAWKSCCDNADVVRTQFRVNKTDGDNEWYYQLPNKSWKRIPPDVIHWGEHEPDGRPTLFIVEAYGEVCFFPPEEGI